jgi:hypothetical protein
MTTLKSGVSSQLHREHALPVTRLIYICSFSYRIKNYYAFQKSLADIKAKANALFAGQTRLWIPMYGTKKTITRQSYDWTGQILQSDLARV